MAGSKKEIMVKRNECSSKSGTRCFFTNKEKDPANDNSYRCSSGGTYAIYNAKSLTSKQESVIYNKWPGKPPSYYACVQGCGGTCIKAGKSFFA